MAVYGSFGELRKALEMPSPASAPDAPPDDEPGGPADDTDRTDHEELWELVRQGERLIDAQLQDAREQDDKAEHMITVTVGILTAGPAAALLLSRQDGFVPGIGYRALVILGFLYGLLALFLFISAYLGWGRARELAIGWKSDALVMAVHEVEARRFALRDILASTILGIRGWESTNSAIFRRMALRRAGGYYFLVVSAICLATAFLLVL